ncbi:MAG TPA: phosphoglycerate dehydrogenase [Deinococcales bacterium]|nr:phosphoglycerate dehydrogenase [Deinococcales bacterium]
MPHGERPVPGGNGVQRVLICDEMNLEGASLEREGFAIEYVPDMERHVLLERLHEYDGLITRSRTRVDAELLAAGPRLRVIGRGGVGVDNIDLEGASRRGILVLNAPEANTVSAAELAITLILAASRGVARSDGQIRNGVWDRRFLGREVKDKTLAIVGLGRIGSLVAARAQGLRMQVIAYDPYLAERRFEQLGVERAASLPDLLRRADVLTVHVPLSEETLGMIGADELALLPRGAVIVNAARGGIVREDALADALESGHVFAAGIDVFSEEPPAPGNPLLGRPDVVCTAHLGANTVEAQERVGTEIVDRLCEALLGDVSRGAVNAPALDTRTRELIGPFMALAEKLGRALAQLGGGQAGEIEVEFAGEFPADTEPVFTSLLVGYLRDITDERPNLINARSLARERGLSLATRTSESDVYLNEVRARAGNVRVAGTCFGRQPRLTRLRDYRLEIAPEGYILVCTNIDRPGAVGLVGTLLGSAGINIAGMQLGRDQPGGKALFALSLDTRPSPAMLETIRALEVIESAQLVEL